ncbi:MaoC family dehydratase N-terminal domain-containing protein [Glycomyces sp. TRM65418]|uniref:FAS1-like dehydratase domain-containing protein n=1 Tax=Glycomyces sp. TRM65418 TaxID=2867006 RepID=UPI001D164FC5|nr:MaoC family dehydratase N-terminal domain-containing protein [Glycomyces sp. TRM65418]MCC3763733.1 MaoC family dehydratase N-terminal domain-containing protein [Glycomyces sp. TRM65418]
MLNASYVGRSLPTTEPVTITAASVTRFAQALGLPDDGTVPPTYLISLTLPAAERLIDDPDFGLDWSRVLHRDQRFAYHRELRAGAAVSCAVTIESIKTVAGNDLLGLHTDVRDGDGVAAEVWTTLFVAAPGAAA